VYSGALEVVSATALNMQAPQPRYSALGSERAALMPTLEDALQRYVAAVSEARLAEGEAAGAARAAHSGRS
jgi:dTDP-4-dehydrorhamnose reductase